MIVKLDHFPRDRGEKKYLSCQHIDGCFQKYWYPKVDGEHNGKPYEQMDDLGGFPQIHFPISIWKVTFHIKTSTTKSMQPGHQRVQV